MKGFKNRSEVIESICNEIIEELQNKIKTSKNQDGQKGAIKLWKDQDSVVSILEKITAIFSRLRGKTPDSEEEEGFTLDPTDIKIIMEFCNDYLKSKDS